MSNDELLLVKKRIKEVLPYGAVTNNLDLIIDMVSPILKQEGAREVIEWVDENHGHCIATQEYLAIRQDKWQALKDAKIKGGVMPMLKLKKKGYL